MQYNMAMPFFYPDDIDSICKEVRLLLEGHGMMTMGENVQLFEKEFAKYINTTYSVATSSCTAALELTLAAMGIAAGDEVIVPAQTFIATGSSVARAGARPIFCEVNENFLIDFDDLKKKITSRTKAVIIVHFAGLIHEKIFEIKEFLKARNIYLIEDAAHAHGASINDIKAGAIGDAGCYSFYSTKNMCMGEGGAVTLSSPSLFKKIASLRSRGIDVEANTEIFNQIGTNNRLTEIQGILGRYQLKRLEQMVLHRNHIAQVYQQALQPSLQAGKITLQVYPDTIRHAYWRFVIKLDKSLDRNSIQKKMADSGIKIDWPYSPLLHLQPAFCNLYGIKQGELLFSEELATRHICLPMHMSIFEENAEFIAKELNKALE